MTVREKIEELNAMGIKDIKLYSNATNEDLPLTDYNLENDDFECFIIGDTADFYI